MVFVVRSVVFVTEVFSIMIFEIVVFTVVVFAVVLFAVVFAVVAFAVVVFVVVVVLCRSSICSNGIWRNSIYSTSTCSNVFTVGVYTIIVFAVVAVSRSIFRTHYRWLFLSNTEITSGLTHFYILCMNFTISKLTLPHHISRHHNRKYFDTFLSRVAMTFHPCVLFHILQEQCWSNVIDTGSCLVCAQLNCILLVTNQLQSIN